ncbi:M10 family metallopeptidase C-terminal domain-containing protein, partial [Ancylobacter sp. Lp-2]|uniref:M10 family metallopeptidase C-terminal domain-containing protein n=1 Tax=Ancylobacter sp. Lp-2 TaxID=2881339 RepID=UPI001E5E1110
MAAGSVTIEATGDDYVDGLIDGVKWAPGWVTFSFDGASEPQIATLSALFTGSYELRVEWSSGVYESLKLYGSVKELTQFSTKRQPGTPTTDVTIYKNNGDIRIFNSGTFDGAYTANPPGTGDGGDIRFNKALNGTDHDLLDPSLGNFAFFTYLQAMGEALGLKSASAAGGVADVAVPADKDALEYTVMSQRSYPGGPPGDYTLGAWDYPQTFMSLDIQALQALYSADYGFNAKDTTYRWDATGAMYVNGVKTVIPGEYLEPHVNGVHPEATKIFLTIWDGGGVDTYDFSNYSGDMSIDLSPGGASLFSQAQRASLGDGVQARGNVYNAYLYNDNPASLIENAVGGSGNDTMRGNSANNGLNGGAGADT